MSTEKMIMIPEWRYDKMVESYDKAISELECLRKQLGKSDVASAYRKSSEKETRLEGVIFDSIYNLDNAVRALNELLNNYHFDYKPSAKKAYEFHTTVNASEKCDEDARRSWEYLYGYEQIMWLVCVARDYCSASLDGCNNAISSDGDAA